MPPETASRRYNPRLTPRPPPPCRAQAFYAACEERDKPALKEVPMAVGGMGMITTANYIVSAAPQF